MKGYIEFSFTLPTCLYLQSDRRFYFPDNAIVTTSEKIETHDSRFGTSQNVELASDVDGAFRFTNLHVFIKDPDADRDLEGVKRVLAKQVVEIANGFIDSFRFLTGRHAIANIKDLEGLRDLNVIRHSDKQRSKGVFVIGFGGANAVLRKFTPVMPEDFHVELEDLATKGGIPLEQYFLMDADRQETMGHSVQALVTAVTALDIALSAKRIKPSWLKRVLFGWDSLQISARKELVGSFPESRIGMLIAAIRERNKVVHAGKRKLQRNASEYISVIRDAVDLLK